MDYQLKYRRYPLGKTYSFLHNIPFIIIIIILNIYNITDFHCVILIQNWNYILQEEKNMFYSGHFCQLNLISNYFNCILQYIVTLSLHRLIVLYSKENNFCSNQHISESNQHIWNIRTTCEHNCLSCCFTILKVQLTTFALLWIMYHVNIQLCQL